MPYQPHAIFDMEGSVRAGQGMVAPLIQLIEQERKTRAEIAAADEFVEMLSKGGRMSPEGFDKYNNAGRQKKLGMVGALTAKTLHDLKLADLERTNAQTNLLQAQGHKAWGGGEDDLTPRPLVTSDGFRLPSWIVPRTGAIIGREGSRRAGAAGPQPLDLATPPGFVWNGTRLVRDRAPDGTDRLERQSRSIRLQNLDAEIAAAQGEMATGNRRPGPDFIPLGTPYEDQLKKLLAQRRAIAGGVEQSEEIPDGATSQQAQGVGGYIPGRRYSGKTYLGGDPNDPNNWQ